MSTPTGPFDTEPYRPRDEHDYPIGPAEAELLQAALTEAGVELGEHDRVIADWLSRWEWSTVATIAGWITRANR